jgi:hypothetical protein
VTVGDSKGVYLRSRVASEDRTLVGKYIGKPRRGLLRLKNMKSSRARVSKQIDCTQPGPEAADRH